MLAIWATFIKELTELRRDRAGLLVLLVMPMTLLIIISLVQTSVLQTTGEAPVRLLFVDRDHSFLGAALARQLQSAGGLETITRLHGRDLDEAAARQAVQQGDFQVCLVIAPGTGEALRSKIGRLTEAAWAPKGQAEKIAAEPPLGGINLYFDPAVQGVLRGAVGNALHRVCLGLEAQERAEAMTRALPRELKKVAQRMMTQMMGAAPDPARPAPAVPEVSFAMGSGPLLAITVQSAAAGAPVKWPTPAQQNVPGWALFGMFFIVVPISGVLIRERHTGTFQRLMTMPISPASLLAGKVGAYFLVCVAQFALMLAAGCYVLPLLGTAGLNPGAELFLVAPIVAAASLAAVGYGLAVGTLAKTYEQASMFGAVSIVIAAALGGVMVPTYVMPHVMQKISVVSPLAWGLTAFQEIFVRNGRLGAVLPQLAGLLAFFAMTIAISGFFLRGTRRA
jgi:ABC-2 type transport system permease protein